MMAKVTVGFGVVLIVLGAWGFIATGSAHPTALIPAYFGLVLAIAGGLATTENAKRRMLWMHIAVTVGLLGFLGTVAAAVDEVRMLSGAVFPHPIAVEEKAAMSVICLVFVVLCVRSFIAARRDRKLEVVG
jgi:multisubunit Na+/H+ antiporter MnhF subunit